MTGRLDVRRVRSAEWREVRDLRLEAVSDPNAAIAFLTTREQEAARDDGFWQERAAGAALGENAAQFVAIDEDVWVGTASVLLRSPGGIDHLDRVVQAPRADVVGVYVAASHRGRGVVERLFDGVAEWASARGARSLILDTHIENLRAQAAYRRVGFTPTGVTLTSAIGPELEMQRPL